MHRWIGWTYVTCALLAGAGGLGFILSKGTVGGVPMTTGFSLYGVLMLVAAVQTARYARGRRRPGGLERHRAWAIRLFALAIGSWLYRIEYGFWFLVAGGAGHTPEFGGWFDAIMDFFFYLPNLAVAELFLRARGQRSRPAIQLAAALGLLAATSFVASPPGISLRPIGGPASSTASRRTSEPRHTGLDPGSTFFHAAREKMGCRIRSGHDEMRQRSDPATGRGIILPLSKAALFLTFRASAANWPSPAPPITGGAAHFSGPRP